jgi:hypothetical protein
MKTLKILSTIGVMVFTLALNAEPWMGSRFTQNCAACHAPGRVNPPETSERRCTFTCKGCHTNPQGGGIRNFYGKWNEERWLRSTYLSEYKLNKPRPQITSQQLYQESKLKSYISGVKDPKDIERLERDGLRLIETSEDYDEDAYDRRSTPAPIVEDLKQVHLRIPHGDPYRLTKANYFNGGVDFRWFYLNSTTNSEKKTGMVPMSTDVGATLQPMDHLNFVWESRFLADPRTKDVWDQAYTTESVVRSAYVMMDDFKYNTYAMYGIYRPMFGNDSADHTTLFARATGLDERTTFKAFGVGTAKNFPFVNMNVIEPFADRTLSQDRGFVFNLGGNFVPWGSFLRLSWWNTKAKDWTTNILSTHRRQALTGGFTKGRFNFVGSVANMMTDEPNIRRDTGTLIQAEPRLRLWRETYLKTSYEYLNTSPTLRFGKATQYGVGFNAFLLSGLEFEIMYKALRSTEVGVDTKETNWWSQLHLFF